MWSCRGIIALIHYLFQIGDHVFPVACCVSIKILTVYFTHQVMQIVRNSLIAIILQIDCIELSFFSKFLFKYLGTYYYMAQLITNNWYLSASLSSDLGPKYGSASVLVQKCVVEFKIKVFVTDRCT